MADRQKTGLTLVMQMARLGDFLQTTPLLRALKSRVGSSLAVLVTPAVAPLAESCPVVDQVWTLDPGPLLECLQAGSSPQGDMPSRWNRLTAQLSERRVDEIYNLNLGPLGAALCRIWDQAAVRGWRWSGRGDGLVGADWSGFVMGLVADRRLTRLHLSDILASYADPPSPPASSLEYVVHETRRQDALELLPSSVPKVVLQLGANSPLRRWPLEYHAAVAGALLAQGAGVILVGSPSERLLAERFLDELGPISHRVCNLMGQTGIPGLAGVLSQADLVISNDTGTLHLATAVGAKVLGLYMGPAVLHETGPYGPHHLVLQARDMCGPCQEQDPVCKGRAQCRRLLKPSAVYKAALALLQGLPPQEAGTGLDLGPHAGALVGEHDGFGQIYRPVEVQESDWRVFGGVALREAGRVLMRSAYEPDWAGVAAELKQGYSACPESERPGLARLAGQAEDLAAAVLNEDRPRAGLLAAEAPMLKPLADLAGAYRPGRLGDACRAAAKALRLALDSGG